MAANEMKSQQVALERVIYLFCNQIILSMTLILTLHTERVW